MWLPAFGHRDTLLDFTPCNGKLLDPWWSLWKGRKEYYDEDGQLWPEQVGQVMVKGNEFEGHLSYVPRCQDGLLGMGDKEYAWFRRLMYEIFKLDPKERMVAKEVIRYLLPSWVVE